MKAIRQKRAAKITGMFHFLALEYALFFWSQAHYGLKNVSEDGKTVIDGRQQAHKGDKPEV
jgi:hypothetical protein